VSLGILSSIYLHTPRESVGRRGRCETQATLPSVLPREAELSRIGGSGFCKGINTVVVFAADEAAAGCTLHVLCRYFNWLSRHCSLIAPRRLEALEGVGYASNSAVSCAEVHGPDS
jgi:hypothetical protein